MLYRNFKIIFTVFSLFMFVSCDQIIDFYNERSKDEVAKKYTSPYMGVYVGSFSGRMSGDLVLSVSKDGYVRGTRTSMNITDDFLGGVGDAGALQSVISTQTGFTLYGNLSSMSGTWKQDNWSGTWTVVKNKKQ
ncbi:hypothetical protein [Elizabethkingia anophelis]|uniref:hypothetical protein n=1 Tax=Elizabethkingia anophelis TaxID=1117645 RepID=UPI0012B43D6D|nr:hypothetical protein [Elizabethkingia anophelis]QGN21432.1 hypothetical protein GJV56_01830 [Elizabethkingia anophelis]QNV08094.1 hypothetical protein EIY88_01825 [Elizabethkingia anophelis]UTF89833.1 hypothetical protein J2N93_01830 [Elizabethkingia anophelis]UTG00704.1 hypothetical protein J2O04_01830 [Elizabethkingia anophelis]UTG04454.1 hypothetical protein J2O03_01835 [Elizabethkingia anophelis]